MSFHLLIGHLYVFEEMSVQDFCLFLNWVVSFLLLLLNHIHYLYILEIRPLSVALFANIFSQSISCLFILFMVSFGVQKLDCRSCERLFATPQTVQSIEYWSGQQFPSPGYLPNPGIKPRFPALQAESLPAEQGKPKNTRVGSLSLLQWTFPTQKSNRGLLYCREIVYQLRYQGNTYKFDQVPFISLENIAIIYVRECFAYAFFQAFYGIMSCIQVFKPF